MAEEPTATARFRAELTCRRPAVTEPARLVNPSVAVAVAAAATVAAAASAGGSLGCSGRAGSARARRDPGAKAVALVRERRATRRCGRCLPMTASS